MSLNPLRDFFEISYGTLEELNLQARAQRLARVPVARIREERMKSLADNKQIKAITVGFTDLEGRFHLLDYDKNHLMKSWIREVLQEPGWP